MNLFDEWSQTGLPEVGFFSTDKTYCKFSLLDKTRPVVISFAMMGSYVRGDEKDVDSSVWSFDYILQKNLNCISFCCIDDASWYRDVDLIKWLNLIASAIRYFPERLGYGGSMGGYGVLAYSDILKMDRVLVMNPITTLSEELAPFEKRFTKAKKYLDWLGEFKDGAASTAQGYIVFDPLFEPDSLHARRLNLKKLRFSGVGHFMPVHLQKLGILNWLFDSFVSGRVDEKKFYRDIRKRRNYLRYYDWLLSDENKYLTPKRAGVIRMYKDFFLVKTGEKEIVAKKSIDKLRDFALEIENISVPKALQAMEIAKEMRPGGKVITRKIKFYKERLSL
ncbi:MULTISPECIES: hypothetical protein [Halomonadaceae]|uniref:hypothetical protein n=1 Tax=Halomonadaceae TaxID=28256 RepID=UPI00248DDE98|nr:hypothetical protein [Halomonas sp. Alg239-R46]|tara:strand:+ start:192 stop:1196 length:1005 start_codon:yes stop_codon:yes gene_type:complete